MSGARLHTLLPELTTRQSVMVVGAAVIDVIADAYALPWRGCDIELKQQSKARKIIQDRYGILSR